MSTKAARTSEATQGSGLASFVERINIKHVLIAYFALAALYIYLPIISIIAFSFNSGGLTFPFVEFTTRWYSELLATDAMVEAVGRSLQLAVVVMIITTILGTAAALAYRYDFWGQRGLLFLLIIGIITPGITYGVGATLFLNELLGLSKSLWLAVPVHVVWTLPFAVIVLLAGFPPNLAENEEAARVMGADNITVLRQIILPQIAPTVLGAAVFAFTLSYNEATRSLLLLGNENTMPLEVFSIASATRATPDLFALGSITTIASTLLIAIAGILVFRGRNS
ncbi:MULTISPECIES: ABC transporter permease [Haloferax]|uniref:ABC transporter permease subunit n=2 Tax=Haloferax TaxID=2251 RepID=A0A6G1Z6B7_9EURY|nr:MULTISPECIES: ABC transporter permease subunit [Haloferax]KAB1185462.1 ABC transporter permease subunit [Haloferax sp. CBA1149]MRW82109.1 ABC transporter permease subunit [Haloferax marinisediminis]